MVNITSESHLGNDSQFLNSSHVHIYNVSHPNPHKLNMVQIVGEVLVLIILMFIISISNILMCYAVYKTPNLRTITNIFTVNLGICDVCIASLLLPMWMITLTQYRTSLPSSNFCNLVGFMTVILFLVSVSTLAGISLDRYFSICHPLRYPMEVTCKRGYIAVIYIWLQSVTLASTPLMGWGKYGFKLQSVHICFPVWVDSLGHTIFMALFGLGLPFSLMIFSYVRIIQEARIQTQRIKELHRVTSSNEVMSGVNGEDKCELMPGARRLSVFAPRWRRPSINSIQPHNNTNRNLKTLKTVFIVVGAFLICWLPYVCVTIWGITIYPKHIPYLADFITTFLLFANSVLNPLVFMLLTRDLRHTVKLTVKKCCGSVLYKFLGFDNSASSAVEVIRMHGRESRGSMDSGVELDAQARNYLNRLMPNQYENDAYEKTSLSCFSDADEPHVSANFLAPPEVNMPMFQSLDKCEPPDVDSSTLQTKPVVTPLFHNIPTIVIYSQLDDNST